MAATLADSGRESWRHHQPCYDAPTVNKPIAKRLAAIFAKHKWSQNKAMMRLREFGATIKVRKLPDGTWKEKVIPPRRLGIRAEREETMNALMMAIINHTCYDPNAPYLFECMVGVPYLAELIGQAHRYKPGYDKAGKYRHGRTSYDPVLGALHDLSAAKMIVLVNEFDQKAKQHKAMRIFLRPELFRELGLSQKETRKMLNQSRKHLEAKGLIEDAATKRRNHLTRLADMDNVASLSRPSARNLLARLKRGFTGEDKETRAIRAVEAHLEKNTRPSKPRHSDLELTFRKLTQHPAIWPGFVHASRQELLKQNPSWTEDEVKAALIPIFEEKILSGG